MNKSIIYSILMGLAMLIACDPIEKRDEMTGSITADQLDISVTAEVVNGIRSNKLILENHSPVLSYWDYGMGTSTRAYDEVLVTSVGDVVVKFTGRNGDGTTITKDITVNVESIVYEVTGMDKFIGDGSKTWVLDQWTNEQDFGGAGIFPYGINGAAGDKYPGWWGLKYGEFDESDAKITFALDGGAIFTKTLSDGTQQKGTFSFNMSKTYNDWSLGTLSLKGATIPYPYSMNDNNGEAYDFYILVLEDDQLVLANARGNGIPDDPTTAPGGEVNIWMFRPEGYTSFDVSEQLSLLAGETEKTWTWATGNCWGNNAMDANGPSWWTLDAEGINGQDALNGSGAKMVFKADGTMEKHLTDGTIETATFRVASPVSDAWPTGSLKLNGSSVLFGRVTNVPEGWRDVYDFGIVELTENTMILGNNCLDSNDGEGWFWVFTAQE